MDTSKKVAKAILQESTTIIIDGKEYDIAPPTYGTLIKISEIVSESQATHELSDKTSVSDILEQAQNAVNAPAVLAVLILGSKRLNDIHVSENSGKWLKWAKNRQEKPITELEYLTNLFTHEARISEVILALVDILNNRMDIAFFLQGSTYLKGINMTKRTKEISQIVPGV